MRYQTCSRHPKAGRFLATCSGCTQELHDLQYGKPAPDPTREAARTALASIGTPAGAHILAATRHGAALIVATDQPPAANFAYTVDVFRLPTATETDPEQVDPRTPGEWILLDQHGSDSRADVDRMIADSVKYLAEIGITHDTAGCTEAA
jgi:sarcosine oxidase gamma subunit